MLKTLAEFKQQSKIYSPVSDSCVPHASVCLCALTVNNNLLYRIKVFAFQCLHSTDCLIVCVHFACSATAQTVC